MTEKVKFGVYLDRDLIEEFHRFIAEQYGKVQHGMVSFEVEQAIRAWLSTHKCTQTALSHQPPNPSPRVFLAREAVKAYLRDRFGYDSIYKVPKSQIIEAIGAVRGVDDRTVKKWIRLFEKFHLLKWITPSVVEFL